MLKSTNDGRLESHGCKVKAFMNIGKLTYPLIRLSQITEPSYDGRFATETTLEDRLFHSLDEVGVSRNPDVSSIQIVHRLPHHIFLVASFQPLLPLSPLCSPISGALRPPPDPSFPHVFALYLHKQDIQFGNRNLSARRLVVTSKGLNRQIAPTRHTSCPRAYAGFFIISGNVWLAAERCGYKGRDGVKGGLDVQERFVYLHFFLAQSADVSPDRSDFGRGGFCALNPQHAYVQ